MRKLLLAIVAACALSVAWIAPANATVIHYGQHCITYGPGIGEPSVNVCMFVYLDTARSSQYTKGQATITRGVAGQNCAYDLEGWDGGTGVFIAHNTGLLCKTNTSFTRNTITDIYSPSDGWFRDDCTDSYRVDFDFEVKWPDGATTGAILRSSLDVNGSAMAPFCA